MTIDPLAPLMTLPGVADRVLAARADVDRLLGERMLRRRSAEVSAEAGLRCVRASAALEGADVSLDDVRTGGAVEDPIVQGALQVTADLGPLAATFERAPLQALARLHVLAASAAGPSEQLGRPRDDGDPAPRVVAARLATLADVLTTPTATSAVVVAAIVHGEVLALQPFASRNGLVARAAARIVLIARGVDPKAVTAPDVGHAEDAAAYADAAARYVAGDVAAWLLHCADALSAGAREGLAVCAALERG